MQLYLKNTHAEHSKQEPLLAQMRADLRPFADIQVKEKTCRVNDYFVVTVPRREEFDWCDDYLTHYLILLSRNIDRKRTTSTCYIDLRR